MVRNDARKHTARAYAAATGISHAAAVRQTRHSPDGFSTLGVHTSLMEALQRAGWPVEFETVPENVEYRGYAGPVRFTVGRADQVNSFGGNDPDPDDGSSLDLSRPPHIEMAAPLIPTGIEAHSEIAGDQPTADVITEVGRMLTDGRARAVRQAANQADCAVCGDSYPRSHLMAAAGKDELPLCPVCAFDGDVFVTGDMASAYLTYQIDDLATTDLAMPAGWAGPAALLAYAAPAGFGDSLESQWRQAGTLLLPAEHWRRPEQLWVWLPPGDRPAPLDQFGPGARLGALVEALDKHAPQVRQRARDLDADSWREAGYDEDEPLPDRFVEQVWPAAVAYAIAFHTQAAERPGHRPPLQHLFGSFDAFRDHLPLIGSDLDADDIESTLVVGVQAVIETLWPADCDHLY
jgi:hypothetical protein